MHNFVLKGMRESLINDCSLDLLAHVRFQYYHPFIIYTAIKFPHPILIPASYKITLLRERTP